MPCWNVFTGKWELWEVLSMAVLFASIYQENPWGALKGWSATKTITKNWCTPIIRVVCRCKFILLFNWILFNASLPSSTGSTHFYFTPHLSIETSEAKKLPRTSKYGGTCNSLNMTELVLSDRPIGVPLGSGESLVKCMLQLEQHRANSGLLLHTASGGMNQ